MGACSSCQAVVSPKEKDDVGSSQWISSQRPSTSAKLPPIREGAEGLLDLGFEYRLVPCDKHQDRNELSYKPNEVCCDCATRLFRTDDSGVMITPENRKSHILGLLYDQVRQATHELVTSWLERDCELKRVDLFSDNDGEPVQALVSRCCHPSSGATVKAISPTLLIITGRGTCRAGVLSTRYTIEAGLERGSALFHIAQAIQRNMTIVCLDPNARGSVNGLDTVLKSLASPELIPYLQDRPLYILAHSAAGGHLVQHLLRQPPDTGSKEQIQKHQSLTNGTAVADDNGLSNQKQQFSVTIPQIKRLAFTDSTHNLQWLSLQERPDLIQFLQDPVCLYIRNNREHPGDTFGHRDQHKKAGEPFTGNDNWLRRFGNITTVYAGTPDHSMLCYDARYVIWQFFDNDESPLSCATRQDCNGVKPTTQAIAEPNQ